MNNHLTDKKTVRRERSAPKHYSRGSRPLVLDLAMLGLSTRLELPHGS